MLINWKSNYIFRMIILTGNVPFCMIKILMPLVDIMELDNESLLHIFLWQYFKSSSLFYKNNKMINFHSLWSWWNSNLMILENVYHNICIFNSLTAIFFVWGINQFPTTACIVSSLELKPIIWISSHFSVRGSLKVSVLN